jgi:FMN reductase
MTRKLVVITAGLGRPSSTRLLADRLVAATREQVAERSGPDLDVQVVELRDLANEIAQNMVTGFPGPRLRTAIDAATSADALIAVTPVFTGSYSGLFKSFFDVLDGEALVDKPVLVAATGGTARHSLALEHALRPMFSYLRAVVVPTTVFAAAEDWGDVSTHGARHLEGPAVPAGLADRIERAALELAVQIEQREPAVVVDPFAEPTPFEQLLAGDTQ